MPRYNVGVHGDDLDAAEGALHSAGILAGHTERAGSDESYEYLVARVDAGSPDEALSLVRDRLPREGRYTLGPTISPRLPEKFARAARTARTDADMEYRGLALKRALVATAQQSGRLRIEAVHLYEDSVRVMYVLPFGEDDDDFERRESHMLLTDDLGTEYYSTGGGSGGVRGPSGRQISHGHTWFKPAVPGAARRLTVATLVGDVTFDL
jgi:hypothetical protein